MRLKTDEKMVMTRPVSPPWRYQVTSREEEGKSCLTTQTFFHSALSFGHCQYVSMSHNDPDHHSNGHILCVTLFMEQYLTGNPSMLASSGHHWKEKLRL